MSNVVSVDGKEAIVATPWRQSCSSLLHNWHLNTHSSHNFWNIKQMERAGTAMKLSLALIPSSVDSQIDRSAAFRALREMVLNSVVSEHSKRNYAKALDEVFALCANRSQGLSRALLWNTVLPWWRRN